MKDSVKIWEEIISIPTYSIGKEEKNPMFLERRVYQGSSGVVYPYSVIDKVFDEKKDMPWKALFLENEFIKIMVLPELGGRIQLAYDKTNDYHFIYYNKVIKPALVGLAGPWISGGIEFNWPQHHRPSTFSPIDYRLSENEDGSKTIWVNEYEKMFHTKCALGFTLHPGKAYIELQAKLYNKTPFPQTFLWWANPAVAVDEHYQSVFPPDVHAVYDHGKRDVSSFPIATGTYYKVDYSPGTDISKYKNIPVPTSYMAVDSEYNFVGGYHHEKKAGMMHIADHHVSPGKKQWTWGYGDFGKAWDKQLTDEDGPYFELMCGVYTDNQPDFSWLMPNETREFKQYFMPYKNIGYIKNASIDAMLNLEIKEDYATMEVYVTKERTVSIELWCSDKKIFTQEVILSPLKTFSEKVLLENSLQDITKFKMNVCDDNGKILVSYSPVNKGGEAIPDPAIAIPVPEEISSIESLYLAGLHLEQYRHATFSPVEYYKEALKRDKDDIRNNNALGLWLLRRGKFSESEAYFRKAVNRLQIHNPNPYDGEPLYNLGMALKYQGKLDEAYKYFFKATWNAAWQDNAYLQLAYISTSKEQWGQALEFSDQSLFRNWKSLKARQLKASLLRRTKNTDTALQFIKDSIALDRFDFGSIFENYLSYIATAQHSEALQVKDYLMGLMRDEPHNYIELSIDYFHSGLIPEAITLLQWITTRVKNPLAFYYLAYYQTLLGNVTEARQSALLGFEQSPDCVFPNRIEDIIVLRAISNFNTEDYKVLYYLGNLFYDKRQYEEARNCWEKSVSIYNGFATVHRNLGIAYYNKFDKKEKARKSFEIAFELDKNDARVLFELDQLYKRFGDSPEQRLKFLQQHEHLVKERDDLYIEYVLLHSLTYNEEKAMELLLSRNFHPWEGGEGKVSGQYVHLSVALAKKKLIENKCLEGLVFLEQAKVYPDSLGEGKLYGAQENDIDFWLGCLYEKAGNMIDAFSHWEKASIGQSEPSEAFFYNDQQPDKLLYRGLALLKTGRVAEAKNVFQKLVDYGERNSNKNIKMDFFAVSYPELLIFDESLDKRNQINCLYLMGLGYIGMGNEEKAKKNLEEVLEKEPAHLGATMHLESLKLLLDYGGVNKN